MGRTGAASRLGAAMLAVAAGITSTQPARAGETITYTYDARGRLVKVERSGTVNNGVTTTYTLDRADTRTKKETAGSGNSGPP